MSALPSEHGIRTTQAGTFGIPPVPSPEEWQERVKQLEALLNEWVADESGYDEQTWPELKAALERDRRDSGDYRKLFSE